MSASAPAPASEAPGCTLGQLLLAGGGASNRLDGGGWVELYRLSAFAGGSPDVVPARALPQGAAPVEPGDVLLSRARNEPRRAWVVTGAQAAPAAASPEWLVLRSERHEPAYLRHVLVSNEFHLRFLRAAGRARHASPRSRALAALVLPCPPLHVQRAVAALLDSADALRRERRSALQAASGLQDAMAARAAAAADSLPDAGVARDAAVKALLALMHRSAERLDALLAVLRDRAYREELVAD